MTSKRCKDAEEVKQKLTAWSLKVAEYEHQFKVIDEALKTFVAREMMSKDIKREFLTGPIQLDEIVEKLEIITNETMADGGPVPMDLGNVGTHDVRTKQRDQDASHDMSCDDVCAIAWTGYKAGKGAGQKGPNGARTWYRGKRADERASGKRDDSRYHILHRPTEKEPSRMPQQVQGYNGVELWRLAVRKYDQVRHVRQQLSACVGRQQHQRQRPGEGPGHFDDLLRTCGQPYQQAPANRRCGENACSQEVDAGEPSEPQVPRHHQ